MRQLHLYLIAIFLLLSPQLGLGIDLADSQIITAMDDIKRIQAQFSEKTTPQDSEIYRALKLLQLTRQRLDTSKNQSHESWALADTRLKNLVKSLQSKLAKKGNPKSSSSPRPTTKNKDSSNTSAQKSESKQRVMISQDRARIKKLTRDIVSTTESLDQGGPKPFQDSKYVEQYSAASDRFHQSLQNYSAFTQDSDVQQATAELQKMDEMILFGKEQAKAAVQELGDVQARLEDFQIQIRDRRPPPAPSGPYSSQTFAKWIEQAKLVRTGAISDFHQLKAIQEKAWLPLTEGTVEEGGAFDMQDVTRLLNVLQQDVTSIDDTLKQLEANLQVQVKSIENALEWFKELDPTDQQSMEHVFLGEGREKEALARLDRELETVEAAITFDSLLKRKTLAERQSLRDTIVETKFRYRAQRRKALELVRMPKSVTTDPELLRIANETLAKPKYEIGRILRLVIISDKVHQEKETNEIEIDEVDVSMSGDVQLSGTKTTTRYEWQQFQVATAEPVGNTYFIFFNLLKYFTAGATTTPLNRWVLSQRIQSSEIPKENIVLE